MNTKHLKVFAIAAVILLALLCSGALAAESDFVINSSGKITGYTGSDTVITIPRTVNGITVTEVGDWLFMDNTTVTSVTIPDYIPNVGWWVFGGCTSLTDVKLPNSMTSIGAGLFYGCTSLETVAIPHGVTEINRSAFEGCSALTSIKFPDKLEAIYEYAFLDCSSLKEIVIPDAVTTIGEEAFSGCTSLVSAVLPASAKEIVLRMFYGCKALKNVSIPAGVTRIDSQAFYNCDSLETIVLPENLAQISSMAFCNCNSLVRVVIPEPKELIRIDDDAFSECGEFKTIVFPKTGMVFGNRVFQFSSKLTAWVYEDSGAHDYCRRNGINCRIIGSVAPGDDAWVLPDELETICAEAFAGDVMTEVVIPGGCTSIGSRAFADCKNLNYVFIPDSVKIIAKDAFEGSLNLALVCNASSEAHAFAKANGIPALPSDTTA